MAIHNDSMFGHASIKQAGCEQMRMQLQLIWCGDVSVDTGYLQVSGACRKRSLRATALLIEVRLPGEPNLRRLPPDVNESYKQRLETNSKVLMWCNAFGTALPGSGKLAR